MILMTKGTAKVVYLVMGVILVSVLAGGTLWLLSIIPSNEQVARLNTELLRSKIHEACIKENTEIELQGFSLPQVKPANFVAANILAAYRIKGLGDPEFVLYYEAFPIGEGLGWEVYQSNSIGHRIFAPITVNSEDLRDINNFEKALYLGENSRYNKAFQEAIKKEPEISRERVFVVIPNIMLSDYVNIIPTSEAKPVLPTIGKVEYKKGNAGEWIYKNKLDQQDLFRLDLSLSNDQKSFVKYRPCGVRSLCLKTPETVARIPLSSACNDIQYVHLNYVASDSRKLQTSVAVATGGAVTIAAVAYGPAIAAVAAGKLATLPPIVIKSAAFGKWLLSKALFILRNIPFLNTLYKVGVTTVITKEGYEGLHAFSGLIVVAFASVKTSDFYVASPCTIDSTVTIKKIDCSLLKGSGPDRCERWLKYPIYNVFVDENGKKVQEVGTHYQCVEGLGPPGNPDVKPDDAPSGKCLQVTVKDPPQGFCWTKNAYREQWRSWFYNDVSSFFEFNTVVDNTEFLNKNTIHVKPINNPFGISSSKNLIGIEWKWPG